MNQKGIQEFHVVFHGLVQGVFFRATVEKYARKLGILGRVRNQTDGTVLLRVQCQEKDLKSLITKVQENPGVAQTR